MEGNGSDKPVSDGMEVSNQEECKPTYGPTHGPTYETTDDLRPAHEPADEPGDEELAGLRAGE